MKSIIFSALALVVFFSTDIAAETGEECAGRFEDALALTEDHFNSIGTLESSTVEHGKGGDIIVEPRFTCDAAPDFWWELELSVRTMFIGGNGVVSCRVDASGSAPYENCSGPLLGDLRGTQALDTAEDVREAKRALRAIAKDL